MKPSRPPKHRDRQGSCPYTYQHKLKKMLSMDQFQSYGRLATSTPLCSWTRFIELVGYVGSCECGEYPNYRSLRVGLAYCSSPRPDYKKIFSHLHPLPAYYYVLISPFPVPNITMGGDVLTMADVSRIAFYRRSTYAYLRSSNHRGSQSSCVEEVIKESPVAS